MKVVSADLSAYNEERLLIKVLLNYNNMQLRKKFPLYFYREAYIFNLTREQNIFLISFRLKERK